MPRTQIVPTRAIQQQLSNMRNWQVWRANPGRTCAHWVCENTALSSDPEPRAGGPWREASSRLNLYRKCQRRPRSTVKLGSNRAGWTANRNAYYSTGFGQIHARASRGGAEDLAPCLARRGFVLNLVPNSSSIRYYFEV
eukprot:SAG31_NODE_5838_length_2304_cov_2.103949_1_plen_139_part_00